MAPLNTVETPLPRGEREMILDVAAQVGRNVEAIHNLVNFYDDGRPVEAADGGPLEPISRQAIREYLAGAR